jgi:glycosyltransferase involved in cell wall biosynthesis
MTPTTSVVIPCFNYGHYLPDAVRSCLEQTQQPVQVLVVDDGSTDDTAAIAASLGPAIEYLWQENRGPSAARNAGTRGARGDLVVFLDADDMLAPNYLEACARVLTAASPTTAYAYTPMRLFGRVTGQSWCPPFSIRTLKYGNYVHASAMFRRDVLMRFPYDEDMRVLEDYDLYLTLAEQGLGGARVRDTELLYRKHESRSDALNRDLDWAAHQQLVARHPALYPRRARVLLAAFHEVERVHAGRTALYFARRAIRELTGARQ